MRHARIVATLLVGSAVGCTLSHRKPSDDSQPINNRAKNPNVETSQVGEGSPCSLWETSSIVLNSAFGKFAASPGTIPDLKFASLEKVKSEVRFVAVPDGWIQWRESDLDIREIAHDEGEFRIYIIISNDVSRDAKRVPPNGVMHVCCEKGKGDVAFQELRAVQTEFGQIQIELRVQVPPGSQMTLADLLAHLRKHYGKYQGVCQQVRELVTPK